jgi:BirA family transcriptional regulator, biotin operon repressor / biotin---[acetyl-CoA-carboxylase] ligase
MLQNSNSNKNIIWLDEIDSTNSYANQLLKENFAQKSAIVASFQTAGKGQAGNVWSAEKGKNILMSWVIFPESLLADEIFYLTKLSTKAILEFLNQEFNLSAKIKWPNDILIEEKKIGGILIENAIVGNKIKHAIIGIGLNINQTEFDENLKHKITSVKDILKKDFDVKNGVVSLLKYLNDNLEALNNKAFQQFNDFYFNNLFWLNETHSFKIKNEIIIGKIIGVEQNGKLIVSINNELKTFLNKEIEYVI